MLEMFQFDPLREITAIQRPCILGSLFAGGKLKEDEGVTISRREK